MGEPVRSVRITLTSHGQTQFGAAQAAPFVGAHDVENLERLRHVALWQTSLDETRIWLRRGVAC
jgi:hypothetical protein